MIRMTIKEDDEIELNLPVPNPTYVKKVEEKANFSDIYMKEMDRLREEVNQMTRIIKTMQKKKRSDMKKDQKKKHRKRLNSKKWKLNFTSIAYAAGGTQRNLLIYG